MAIEGCRWWWRHRGIIPGSDHSRRRQKGFTSFNSLENSIENNIGRQLKQRNVDGAATFRTDEFVLLPVNVSQARGAERVLARQNLVVHAQLFQTYRTFEKIADGGSIHDGHE